MKENCGNFYEVLFFDIIVLDIVLRDFYVFVLYFCNDFVRLFVYYLFFIVVICF